ncbi:MAG: FecR domain-containing protein, partial [Anaerolineales bacterium]|nr:FecR domain-containing protein [Anaerolineales bacterium]
MSKIDDLLQQKLEALESGQALDKILEELPEEARELGALIGLASALQTMPHPQPQMQNSLASLQSAAARKTIRPAHQRRSVDWAWPRLAYLSGGVGVALVLLIALVSLSALGVWMAGPRAAHVATLMDVRGVVGVGPGDSTDGWDMVSDGSQIGEGQRIRTGSQGSVTLVFFDGTRTTLAANTDLTLTKVDGRWGNVLQVELSQQAGDTNHSVVPFQGKKSAYLVHTPSGTVSVHGTIFNISVNEMGQARFAVDTGQVMVTGQDSEVILEAGQATTAQPGQALESPAYQFKLEGILTDDEGDTWG